MKNLAQRLFPVTATGDLISMLIYVVCCSMNVVSACIQIPKLIAFFSGNGDDWFIPTIVLIINLCFIVGIGKVELNRRKGSKLVLRDKQELQDELRREQEREEQEQQEQFRLLLQQRAEQQAVEKVERQLITNTHQQVSLPEIFASRRQRQPV